jgi:hypothetical protein
MRAGYVVARLMNDLYLAGCDAGNRRFADVVAFRQCLESFALGPPPPCFFLLLRRELRRRADMLPARLRPAPAFRRAGTDEVTLDIREPAKPRQSSSARCWSRCPPTAPPVIGIVRPRPRSCLTTANRSKVSCFRLRLRCPRQQVAHGAVVPCLAPCGANTPRIQRRCDSASRGNTAGLYLPHHRQHVRRKGIRGSPVRHYALGLCLAQIACGCPASPPGPSSAPVLPGFDPRLARAPSRPVRRRCAA